MLIPSVMHRIMLLTMPRLSGRRTTDGRSRLHRFTHASALVCSTPDVCLAVTFVWRVHSIPACPSSTCDCSSLRNRYIRPSSKAVDKPKKAGHNEATLKPVVVW